MYSLPQQSDMVFLSFEPLLETKQDPRRENEKELAGIYFSVPTGKASHSFEDTILFILSNSYVSLFPIYLVCSLN